MVSSPLGQSAEEGLVEYGVGPSHADDPLVVTTGVEEMAAADADKGNAGRKKHSATTDLSCLLRHKTRMTLHYGHKDDLSLLG